MSPGPDPPRGLALVGYRGTGKSTVGRLVAEALGRPFVDADTVLEARFGLPIRQVFRDLGEPTFRDWEEEVLHAVTADPAAVVATGGGVVLRESNRSRLKEFGFVVWLSADAAVLAGRLASDPRSVADRPALTPSGTLAEIAEVLASRLPLYREVADAEVTTDGRTPEEVARAVIDVLASLPR
jgi:shikimate kinase